MYKIQKLKNNHFNSCSIPSTRFTQNDKKILLLKIIIANSVNSAMHFYWYVWFNYIRTHNVDTT